MVDFAGARESESYGGALSSPFGMADAVALDGGEPRPGSPSFFASRVCSAEQGRATFTGYVADAETGLCYALARMYSAELGRFVSRDPLYSPWYLTTSLVLDVDPHVDLTYDFDQVVNSYSYAKNGPSLATDPFGLSISVSTTVQEQKAETCGAYNVRWSFFLSEPAPINGYVIQYILTEAYGYNCDDGVLLDRKGSFYEAFPISRGSISPAADDGWSFGGLGVCTKGIHTVIAKAGFFALELPKAFKDNYNGIIGQRTGISVPGDFLHDTIKPSNMNDFRAVLVNWNCCDGKRNTTNLSVVK